MLSQWENLAMKVARNNTLAAIAAVLTIFAGWTVDAGTTAQVREKSLHDVSAEAYPEHTATLPIQEVGSDAYPFRDRTVTLSSLPTPLKPGENGNTSDRTYRFLVIDTRSIPTGTLKNPPEALTDLRFFAADESGMVRRLTTDDWVEDIEKEQPLWVVVHGNRVDSGETLAFMTAFCQMCRHVGLNGVFVLWSWPSGVMVRGIARDSRLKAVRADLESSVLASWLASHSLQRPVNLVGYSFGARTVMQAAWQIATQKSVALSDLPGADARSHDSPAFTLFLVAPAMDTATFDRTIRETLEASPSLKVFVTVNKADPALRWYRHLWSCHGPSALGWQGPFYRTQKDLVDSLEVLDVTRQVGHTHRLEAYLSAPTLRRAFQKTDESLSTP